MLRGVVPLDSEMRTSTLCLTAIERGIARLEQRELLCLVQLEKSLAVRDTGLLFYLITLAAGGVARQLAQEVWSIRFDFRGTQRSALPWVAVNPGKGTQSQLSHERSTKRATSTSFGSRRCRFSSS